MTSPTQNEEICECGHERREHFDFKPQQEGHNITGCEKSGCSCKKFTPRKNNHIEPDESRASNKNDAVSRIDGSPFSTEEIIEKQEHKDFEILCDKMGISFDNNVFNQAELDSGNLFAFYSEALSLKDEQVKKAILDRVISGSDVSLKRLDFEDGYCCIPDIHQATLVNHILQELLSKLGDDTMVKSNHIQKLNPDSTKEDDLK